MFDTFLDLKILYLSLVLFKIIRLFSGGKQKYAVDFTVLSLPTEQIQIRMHDLYNNQNIDFNIRQIWLKLSRLYNQKAIENDLTLSIGFILLIIDKTGTPSTQIGPNMGMEPTSLSRTLKLMEETGLIYRVEDLIDKRKVLVFLTEKGILQRKNAKAIVVDFNVKVKSKIAQGKLKTFFEVLEKLDGIVEDDLKKLNAKQK